MGGAIFLIVRGVQSPGGAKSHALIDGVGAVRTMCGRRSRGYQLLVEGEGPPPCGVCYGALRALAGRRALLMERSWGADL